MDAAAAAGLILASVWRWGWRPWLAMAVLWLLDFTVVTAAEGTSFYS